MVDITNGKLTNSSFAYAEFVNPFYSLVVL
jgi:hypothetical protein